MEKTNLFHPETLERFAQYVTIAHHVPGRVRFKFNPAILKELGEEAMGQLERFHQTLEGIREVRVNKLARSATIAYDKTVIEPEFFEQLARGEIPPGLSTLIKGES